MKHDLPNCARSQLGVYILHNSETNHVYVGSGQLYKRFNSHKNKLEQNKHSNERLQRAYNKNPKFEFVSVPCATELEARTFEQAVIDEFYGRPRFLNLVRTVDDFNDRPPMTEETKRKIAEARKGRTLTEEAKAKISAFHKGNQWNSGKRLTDETKSKIQEASQRQWSDPVKAAEMKRLSTEAVARAVLVGDQEFETVTEAAKTYNLSTAGVRVRIRSKNFDEWKYKELNPRKGGVNE